MLNLKLEVDLKLSQAEKARFASEKEQADKSAFYSELERAEKASTNVDTPKVTTKNSANEQHTDEITQKPASDHNEKVSDIDKPMMAESKKSEALSNSHSEQIESREVPLEESTSEASEQAVDDKKKNLEQIATTKDTEQKANSIFFHGQQNHAQVSAEGQQTTKPVADNNTFNAGQVEQPEVDKPNKQNINTSSHTGTLTNAQIEPTTSDKLLAQIQASTSQTTDVKQHLAPVPKALKDVLTQFDSSKDALPVNTEKKADKISPPDLGRGENEAVRVMSAKSELVSLLGGQMQVDKKSASDTGEVNAASLLASKASKATQEPQGLSKNGKPQILNEQIQSQPVAQSGKVNEELTESVNNQASKSEKLISNVAAQQTSPKSSEKPSLMVTNEMKPDAEVNKVSDLNAIKKSDINITQKSNEQNNKSSQIPADKRVDTITSDFKQSVKEPTADTVSISNEAKVVTHLDKVTERQEGSNRVTDKVVNLADKTPVNPGALEQQIKSLPNQEKLALHHSLQQAVDSGKLDDVQLERAEQTLSILKSSNDMQSQDSKKTDQKVVNVMGGTATQTKGSADLANYNSTKVTTQSLSETAQASVEQTKNERVSMADLSDVMQANNEQFAKQGRKAEMSPQTENIFKSIIQQTPLANVQSTHDLDISQSVQQFDNVLQNAQTQQSASVTQKASTDPNTAQTFNLQKNDAVKALHDKVNAMLNINNKEAEIRLDPPELGSMQIRIRSEAEQAQVNFVVQNQQAKEALEQSMPKLKEMLAEQGIQLGESNIQQDSGSSSEQGTDEAQELGNSKLANQESQAQNSQQTRTNSSSSESGIDYYA
ncbi:flagellar hook-length control protein FliK [Pseudoalteromonas sp. SS15]|uniref:flagellar hook-length control protein FliK n=1 Tax=Pseudoalteromonas sp. SS15 TaxID=3139393 RepID=UPI003BABB46F